MDTIAECPIHQTQLDQINIRFQAVGYCRHCQKEYYRLPDGRIVDRREFYRLKAEYAW